jgi:hypothetical protein
VREAQTTVRRFSAEEKIRIVIEGLRGEEGIASLCRRDSEVSGQPNPEGRSLLFRAGKVDRAAQVPRY